MAYLEKCDSNGDLFWNSEVAIVFVASKRVHRRYRFLILSLGWLCKQNDAFLNWHFHSFSRKTQLWANDIKHIHIIYHWKWFLATINNMTLLPENKALFGLAHNQSFDSLSRKAYFEIRPFSSQIKDTITIVRLSRTCLSPEPPSTMARGDGTESGSRASQARSIAAVAASRRLRSCLFMSRAPLCHPRCCLLVDEPPVAVIA